MYYFEVAPLKIVRATSAEFTYHAAVASQPPIGSLVAVTVGSRQLIGLVTRHVVKPDYPTKPVDKLYDDIPPLPEQLVATARWMSEYYATHLATVLSTVIPAGITKQRKQRKNPPAAPSRSRTHFVLNSHQRAALEVLQANPTGTSILHGVTGSGKTAVYIEYARTHLRKGRSVTVLVPEIALTPQLVAEFRQHFPDVVVTHSRQTEAERHLSWLSVAQATTPQVIIGPRSALFMPVARLGAIIIDEAHEPSFKQEQSPRYSALRVASIIAQHHEAAVIQGTATPLVTEYFFASQTSRPIIRLPEKATPDMQAASTTVIDMTKRGNFRSHRFFSDALLSAMKDLLADNRQCLIYHNRRGSASTTLCEHCGWSAHCPRCFVPFTLHADLHTLRCHICGNKQSVPTSCPDCGSTDVIHKGIGTKLIEAELTKMFPTARIARFDGDTADNSVDKQYQALYDGDIDIIIGTQVIAKGLDLPKLGMVGVVQADAGLSLPDFTSAERTFQLIAQVVGRVGRTSHRTSLIIQSYQPTHPAIQLGIAQDYDQFYHYALSERQRALFPPFRHLLQLTCSYKTEAAAIRNARALASQLKEAFPSLEILGPTPAFYERQRDSYRWQITVKATRRADLIEAMKAAPSSHWQATLDPYSLL